MRVNTFAKRTLSLILSLAILTTGLVMGMTSVATGGVEAWNGTDVTKPSGAGSETDPVLITNGAELAYVIKNGGGAGQYFKFMNDIYLNDIDKIDWTTGAVKEGENYTPNEWFDSTKTTAFKGHILGNGKIVHGLYYKKSNDPTGVTTGYGLIPKAGNETTITGLGIENSYMEAYTNYCFGAFIGNGQSNGMAGYIDQCYVGSTVTLKGFDVGTMLGGGYIPPNKFTIKNSYSLAKASGSHLTGVIGDSWSPDYVFENFYAVGVKLIGKYRPETATNTYTTVASEKAIQVTEDDLKGALAEATLDFDFDNVFVTVKNGYPDLRIFGRHSVNAKPENAAVWNGTLKEPTRGGDGSSETNPIFIYTAEELAWAVNNGGTKHYKLVSDIYLNDIDSIDFTTGAPVEGYTPNTWFFDNKTSDGYYKNVDDGNVVFRGSLNGNGHTVYGLYYAPGNTHTSVGLIPATNGAKITNLELRNSFVCGGRWTAALVGYATSTTIEEVVIDSSVTIWGYDAGNVYYKGGEVAWPLNGNAASGIQFGSNGAGGIAGYANSSVTVKNTAVYAPISEPSYSITTTNPLVANGAPVAVGNPGHIGGIIGACWDTAITVEDCVSLVTPNDGANNKGALNFTDVYTTASKVVDSVSATKVTSEDILGDVAEEKLTGLDWNLWKVTAGYPTLKQFVKTIETGVVWDGSEVAPTEGKGTEGNPILIYTAEQLAYVVANGGGKYYKLVADIYLNDITKIDFTNGTAEEGYTPNEWYYGNTEAGTSYNGGKKFTGTIDGNGHTVYGLYYTPGNVYTAVGLLPVANNITVKNLRIRNSFISGGRWTSALIGDATSATIEQVVIDSSVTIWGYNAGNHYYHANASQWTYTGSTDAGFQFSPAAVGPIMAYGHTRATVKNVASYPTIKTSGFTFTTTNPLVKDGAPVAVGGSGHTNGIFGTTWVCNVTIENTFSLMHPCNGLGASGDVFTSTNAYYVYGSEVANVPATKVSITALYGETAEEKLSGLDWDVWQVGKATYPTLKQFYSEEEDKFEDAGGEILEGTTYLITEIEGKYKTQGRTTVIDGVLKLDWTAAGLEWNAYCEGDVYITVCSETSNPMYFSSFVDGVMQYEDMRIPEDIGAAFTTNSTGYPYYIDKVGFSTFKIAENLPAGNHTFEIYRQSQAGHGEFGVYSITMDGDFGTAPAKNDLYIEFIGDSITAGQGMLTSEPSYSAVHHEDATRGWAFLTAKTLGADWSVVAQSGVCAIDGLSYSPGPVVSMREKYPMLRYLQGDTETEYDFARQPDVVVIGLGTNDMNCWNREHCAIDQSELKPGFKKMFDLVREKNPNAKIVWIYGMMTGSYKTYVQEIMEEAGGAEAGFYTLQLPHDNKGGQGHPTLASQSVYAEAVSNFISEITAEEQGILGDLTGDDIVDICDLVKLQAIINKNELIDAADLNSDGNVDSLDAAELRKLIISKK